MKSLLSLVLLSSIIMSTIASAQSNDGICTMKAKKEVALRNHNNQFATNDVALFTFFSLPIVLMFPPTGVALGVPVGFKVVAAVKAKNARQILAMYEEAARGGGKQSRKIYKKIMKAHPNSELSYEDFLAEIHRSDLDGSSCQKNIPSKKDVISIFETEA